MSTAKLKEQHRHDCLGCDCVGGAAAGDGAAAGRGAAAGAL